MCRLRRAKSSTPSTPRGETMGPAAGVARAAGCSGSRPGPTAGRGASQPSPSAIPRATRRWVSRRVARPGDGHGGQPFGEDTTRTGAIAAKPLAHAQLEAHPILCPGQVRQGAPIVTMDAPRGGGTQRTGALVCVDCTRRVICAVVSSISQASRCSTVASGNKRAKMGGSSVETNAVSSSRQEGL